MSEIKAFIRLIFAVVVLSSMLAAPAMAAPASPDDGGYTIKSYDVRARISEDRAYDVTETIEVNFTEPRHGIYRNIAAAGGLAVGSVEVPGREYTIDTNEDGSVVRIGSASTTVTGSQSYTIHYRLAPMQGAGAYDAVDFNIVGMGWDTTIDHVTFSVELPKPFDAEAVSLVRGNADGTGFQPGDLSFSVDGNLITGSTSRRLESNEGLSLLVKLPQGYFNAGASTQDGPAGLPDEPVKDDGPAAPPYEPQRVEMPAGLPAMAGLAAAPILLFLAGVVVIIVLAVAFGARNRAARPFDPAHSMLSDDEANRRAMDNMNHMNHINHMNDINAMNAANTMNDAGSANNTNTGGGANGGGSW